MSPELLIPIAIFIISLAALIGSAEFFTRAAERIGLHFGIPSFVVGVTIVALGTSLPELISSIVAVNEGSSEIVIGNVVGSNIANIFLVLAFAAIIGKQLKISHELIHVDLPLLMGSAFMLAWIAWDMTITWGEGLLCLAGIVIYLLYTIRSTREENTLNKRIRASLTSLFSKEKSQLGWLPPTILLASAFGIYISAQYTINSIIEISEIMNVGKEIIAMSAVAIGTSLPELLVSFSAAKNGNPEIAVGNVLGSNIFNSFVVVGIPSFFGTLVVPRQILEFSIPVMIVATLLYFFMTQDRQITRYEGSMLLIFYVMFIGKLFHLF